MDEKKDDGIYVTKKEFYKGMRDIHFILTCLCFMILIICKFWSNSYSCILGYILIGVFIASMYKYSILMNKGDLK